MSSNQIFEAATIAVFVLYLGVLAWTLRGSESLLLNVNIGTALAIIVYNLMPPSLFLKDANFTAILGFEALAIAAAVLAHGGNRPALFLSYAVFGVHLCVSALAVFYACCVRINRLI